MTPSAHGLLAVLRHKGVRRIVAVALECMSTFLDEVAGEVFPEGLEEADGEEEDVAEPPWYGGVSA